MQFLVALLVGVGVGTWVYTKILRSTGGNTKSTLIVAGVTGVGVFILTYLLAVTLLKP